MSLLDQALEDGCVVQELVMPDAVYRVTTRISFDAEKAWLFRCAVARDGVEIAEEPWLPVLHNLTQEVDAASAGDDARTALARRALETQLATYARLSRMLQQGKTLATSRGFEGFDWRIFWVGLGAALGLSIALGMYQGWQTELRWWKELSYGLRARATIGPEVQEVTTQSDGELVGGVTEGSQPSLDTAAEPSPTEPAEQLIEARTHEPVRPQERREQVLAKPHSHRRPRRRVEKQPAKPSAPPAVDRTARVPPAVAAERPAAPPPAPAATSRETRRDTEESTRNTRQVQAQFDDVRPSDHRFMRLTAGEQIYADADIRISEVPSELANLHCVTTETRQGDGEQGIFFTLKTPQVIYVAHHRRVKKKPRWLSEFTPTGEVLVAQEVDKGRKIEFSLYRKNFLGGAVALGANTGAKNVTKRLRGLVPKKKLVMYLVCIAEVRW